MKTLRVGDIAVIQDSAGRYQEWDGLRCAVLQEVDAWRVYVRPLSERPDGYGTALFVWTRKDLVKVGRGWGW